MRLRDRVPVACRRGAVACGNQAAAEIGIDMLRMGGSAVDATIAAAFASFIVEPQNCGVGGHGRMSVYMADTGYSIGIDHFIRAPALATPDMYRTALERWRDLGRGGVEGTINTTGHLAVGIPGAVSGLWEAHRHFGRLSWGELVSPAIELARSGLGICAQTMHSIGARSAEIGRFPEVAAMLLPHGSPLYPPLPKGSRAGIDFSALARTLECIAEHGAAAFYEGQLAAAIGRDMRENGGLLTESDLACYCPDINRLPEHDYRGLRYVTGGDLIFVECLNILERFDLTSMGHNSIKGCHILAEALAQSFADNFAYASDPRHLSAPLEGLASKEFANAQAGQIDLERARMTIKPGDPWPHQSGKATYRPQPFEGTTQVCAADGEGNMVSLITSLGSSFGSLVLVPDTGIFLGNAMQWFDPKPGLANSVGPGKMPLYAAPVVIAFDGDTAVGALAGSGGYRIQAAILHSFVNHLDYGLHPQAAIDAARFHLESGTLEVDSRLPDFVYNGLAALGHHLVKRKTPDQGEFGFFGRPSAVWRDRDGSLIAASDASAGGVAALD